MSKTLVRGLVPDETFNELKCIDEAECESPFTRYLPHLRHQSSWLDTLFLIVPSSPTNLPEGHGFEMASHQSQWWDNLPDYKMHLFLREATDYSLAIVQLNTANKMEEILRLMPQVADLVKRIKEWHPKMSRVQPEFAESIQHFNCIWKIGMLCFVYSEIYALGPNDDLVKGLVQTAMEPLKKLSWLQACLFPLFMIALHAQTEEARWAFEEKLSLMHTTLGFQGPLSVISILKNIWSQSDDTIQGRVRWREVIKNLGAEINILLW